MNITDKSSIFRTYKEILQIKKEKGSNLGQTLQTRRCTTKLESINLLVIRKMQIKSMIQ